MEFSLNNFDIIRPLRERQGVQLVSHKASGHIYILKIREHFDIDIYQYLIEHPKKGLPRIIEYGVLDAKLCVIEEYINGESLEDLLEREGILDLNTVLHIIVELCQILAPLHRLKHPIVHRDIKPSNIMVSRDGSISLIDFNTAKYSDEKQSRDTVLIGTKGYAAPEQYGFSVSKPSTDIYALGILMNQLLTGALPTEELHQGPLKDIILKCCSIDPKNRYQNASKLLAAINESLLEDGPYQILPDGWRAWLIPGFRSNKIKHKIFSSIGYLLLLASVAEMDLESGSFVEDLIFRLWYLFMILSMVFFFGNYRNVQMHVPFIMHKSKGVRIFMKVIVAFIIQFVLGICMVALSSLFGSNI